MSTVAQRTQAGATEGLFFLGFRGLTFSGVYCIVPIFMH
jgi:hypothetical protein